MRAPDHLPWPKLTFCYHTLPFVHPVCDGTEWHQRARCRLASHRLAVALGSQRLSPAAEICLAGRCPHGSRRGQIDAAPLRTSVRRRAWRLSFGHQGAARLSRDTQLADASSGSGASGVCKLRFARGADGFARVACSSTGRCRVRSRPPHDRCGDGSRRVLRASVMRCRARLRQAPCLTRSGRRRERLTR